MFAQGRFVGGMVEAHKKISFATYMITTFATLQEAWGVSTFGEPGGSGAAGESGAAASPADSPAKRADAARDVLDRTEGATRELLFVTTYIRRLYKERGVSAVLGLMDPEVLRAVRTEALLSFEWLNADALLFGFLVVCALWLLADVLRRPGA